MLSIAFVLLQYMISAKAGLVNYVDGQANVHIHEQVSAGTPIETQAQGHVELLLTPGSFLRVGTNSKVVLDSVELKDVAVRIVDGAAIIEVAEIEKHAPIKVVTGGLQTLIVSRGIYRFSNGTAAVLDGKLRLTDAHITVKKGHQVTSTSAGYLTAAVPAPAGDDLDRWSQGRSAALATANAMAYKDRSTGVYSSGFYYPYWNIYSNRSSWVYSSLLGGFTFIPLGGYRSYYGYTFLPVAAFGAIPSFPVRSGGTFGSVPPRPGSSANAPRPGGIPSRPAPGGSGTHRPAGGYSSGHGGFHGSHGHR